MKKTFLLIFCCTLFLVSACTFKNKQNPLEEQPQVLAQTTTESAKTVEPKNTTSPAVQPTKPTAPLPTTQNTVQASGIESEMDTTSQEPTTPTVAQLPSLKDIKQFKDEELISLE
ncbi:MAG: hypothetical protein J6S61_03360, partial [Elusimicrobiaceae bacterium]|nr:hypothetical protein [Elusimicrobiaceae bacterium]